MQLDKYIGKPYEENGSGPNTFDCYGLASAIRAEQGLYLPDHLGNSPIEIKRDVQIAKFKAELLLTPLPFCLALFKPGGKFVTHIGVVLENCYQFIHILEGSTVKIDRLDSAIWKHKLEGYYEFPAS